MDEETLAETQSPCETCAVEARLQALEEVLDETRKVLTALRRETKQLRTILDGNKEK